MLRRREQANLVVVVERAHGNPGPLRQFAHRAAPGRFVGRAPAEARDRLRYATRAYFNLAEVYYLASRHGITPMIERFMVM